MYINRGTFQVIVDTLNELSERGDSKSRGLRSLVYLKVGLHNNGRDFAAHV